jgi:hypothetical protein
MTDRSRSGAAFVGAAAVGEFKGQLGGDVTVPGDDGYDAARAVSQRVR